MVHGVCVFDLDGTLYNYKCAHSDDVCLQHMRGVVQHCVDNGYGIAINTARFRIPSRIKTHLRSLGLDVDLLPPGAVQLRAYTPRRKGRAMDRIAKVYSVKPHQMVLYDNLQRNVHAAMGKGYHGVNVVHEGFVHPAAIMPGQKRF